MTAHGEYVLARTSQPSQLRRNATHVILTWWTEDEADGHRLGLPDAEKWFVRKLAAKERGGSRSYRPKAAALEGGR